MTEPIKLPKLPEPWNFTRPTVEAYTTLAIEQVTADLRERLAKAEADSNVWAERYRKAALERDEARAEIARLTELLSDVRAVEAELAEKSDELARLTTLRPMSEYDGSWAIYWRTDGPRGIVPSYTSTAEYWTPLPDVKEADHD